MAAIPISATPLASDPTLYGYWPLIGNSNDAGTGGNNGSDTDITYGNYLFGGGASFNGSTSIISATSNPTMTSYTCHGWIKTTLGQVSDFGAFSKSGVLNGIVHPGNRVQFAAYNTTPTFYNINPFYNFLQDTWYMFDIIWDTANNLQKIYVNASSFFGSAGATTGNCQTNTNVFKIGTDQFAELFNGEIVDVALFTRVLSETELTNLYNGTFTSIKAVSGVAYGSVSKVSGVAKASISKISGLA